MPETYMIKLTGIEKAVRLDATVRDPREVVMRFDTDLTFGGENYHVTVHREDGWGQFRSSIHLGNADGTVVASAEKAFMYDMDRNLNESWEAYIRKG